MSAIQGTQTKSVKDVLTQRAITVRQVISEINVSEAATLSVMMFGATQAMCKAKDSEGNFIWGHGDKYYAAMTEIAEVYAAATILSES